MNTDEYADKRRLQRVETETLFLSYLRSSFLLISVNLRFKNHNGFDLFLFHAGGTGLDKSGARADAGQPLAQPRMTSAPVVRITEVGVFQCDCHNKVRQRETVRHEPGTLGQMLRRVFNGARNFLFLTPDVVGGLLRRGPARFRSEER